MDRIDLEPLRQGWGCCWQGSELDAIFDKVVMPLAVVSMVGACAVGPSLSIFMLDNDHDTLPDDLLLSMADASLAFLKQGRNLLIHCFQGKYRSTYMDVAIHMRAGMTFTGAIGLIQQRHPIAELRAATSAQLVRMESTLKGAL